MQAERLASMGQLSVGIAHELNNPLGIVLMYSNLLLEQCGKDSQIAEDLRTIAQEADRCKKIVSGLLNFARRNKVAARLTCLRDFVDGFVCVQNVPDNVVVTTHHNAPTLEAEIDSDQIIQVLTNLATNAFDAMPEGGKLTLETGGDERTVWLKLTDTGVGIPKENMKKLFSPFFTTKKIGQGTGLGLAVSYGIIKMHRGKIDVESNVDPTAGPTGTTFIVRLPRAHVDGLGGNERILHPEDA